MASGLRMGQGAGMKRLPLALLLLVACKPSTQPATDSPDDSAGLPSGGGGPQATLTASECELAGGTVVGDIGDGAIFEPDYVCESTGEPPTASIAADGDGPVAIEGSVCCGS